MAVAIIIAGSSGSRITGYNQKKNVDDVSVINVRKPVYHIKFLTKHGSLRGIKLCRFLLLFSSNNGQQ